MQKVTWRNDWAERHAIRFVESVLGIAAWTPWMAGLVADAQRSVSSGNFGLFAVVIAAREFQASLSSEVIRPVQLFPERSESLRTVTYSAPPPGCQVIAAHTTIMGLWKLLQVQCERQRANNFCFFLPPAVDWNGLTFTLQARFAIVRVMSESRYRDVLAFSENYFPCPIAFAICFPPSATLATDRISTQIDAHFGLPFDYCNKCRCWRRIPFVIGVDDPGNLAVILSRLPPIGHVLRSSAGSIIRFRSQFTARATLQDDHIFKEAIEFGKVFHQKCRKSLRFDSTKQDMNA
jgi:hypothetical protein